MRKKIILMLIVLGIFFTAQSINAQKIVKIELVLPKTTFDVKLAFDMLNTGTSEIKGKVLYEQRAGELGMINSPELERLYRFFQLLHILPNFLSSGNRIKKISEWHLFLTKQIHFAS
jgi:hypothetical protein